jgi:3-dehydroquinate synthase
MRTVHVPLPGRPYDIHIGRGLLQNLSGYIDPNKEYVVITDANIPKRYWQTIAPFFGHPLLLEVPEGEPSKSFKQVQLLIDKMLENGITRGVTVVALGGGVIGDLAGFVASVYMRGVPLIQIPTTLLSQIDSSVGGKVGINTSFMKNAVGSFHQPSLVLIDPDTLDTLPPRQLASGVAELVKYALIRDAALFDTLQNASVFEDLEAHIERCVTIKRDIVVQDEFDTGLRQILNFGHTIGHALEQYSNYELLHGEAVAIGMVMMSRDMPYHDALLQILTQYDLPTSYDYDSDAIFQLITTDKKATRDHLNIILVEDVGNGYIKTIERDAIKARL